ncbi:ankyrin repeat-containing domain protein [Aspergillus egyptiacus]|nr:ankyrin repeat-containing domain protein [Aspergillus egyptiacus]
MDGVNLLSLPEELILEVCRELHPSDLLNFIQTSRCALRIGHPVLYKPYPFPEIKTRGFIRVLEKHQQEPIESFVPHIVPLLQDQVSANKALGYIVEQEDCSLLRLFLDKGIYPPNTRHFCIAVKRHNLEAVKMLAATGLTLHSTHWIWFADAPDRNARKENALHYAARHGFIDIVQAMLSAPTLGLDVNSRDMNHHTALYKAAERGDARTVSVLLACNANVRVSDGEYSPLCAAVRSGNIPIIQALLDAGADIDGDGDRESPLWEALRKDDTKVAEFLIARGANVNHAIWSTTALYLTVSRNCESTVRLLLAHHADVTLTNLVGATALCHAAQSGSSEIIKLLLEAGSDTSIADDNGRIPLLHAAIKGAPSAIELILEWSKELINHADKDGRTALSHVAGRDDGEASVELLVRHGADLNKADHTGRTPVSHALLNHAYESATILIEAGCDVKASDLDLDHFHGSPGLFELAAARARGQSNGPREVSSMLEKVRLS